MRSDKLYKFSDGTLTRLLSLLEDITKNIDMEYLPKRRWSNLEKKKAHFMIKDINKLLKERRMMKSLEKFIGGRLYERIKRTKRSKNDQKPTRNERDKKKSEETARNQKPDQLNTARKAVKGQNNEARDQE
ncbi:hypothetical protein Tco_0000207 [Tanacetum coccineum]